MCVIILSVNGELPLLGTGVPIGTKKDLKDIYGADMGLADRQYMHDKDCICPSCAETRKKDEQARLEDEQARLIENLVAAEKYRRDKESKDNLRKMLGRHKRCKHSRPLSDGEKWEDTFCDILGVPCHVVGGGSCVSEELISTVEEDIPKSNENTDIGERTDVRCPKCGGRTRIRIRSKDKKKFHVCINFPKCKGRVSFTEAWGDDWD